MYVNRDNAKFRKMMESYPHLAEYSDPMKKMERPLIGREREMRAMRAAFERPELSNVVLLGPAGSGKALDDDTLIPVADERGYVRIADISVGDMVFDECGRPVPVQGVFHQGMKHAYEVVFEDGSTITCNDEHLWLVRTQKMHKTRSPHVVRTLREMIDYGITKGADDHSCWYVPSSGAVERDDVELGVDPYVVGALIGDGCLTERHVLAMSSDDEAVVAEVARRLGCSGYSRVSKGNYSWVFDRGDMEVDRVVRSNTKYVQLADLSCMEDLSGIIGVKSVERRIPRQYMLGSVSQRMDLLRGLMDTDGCVTCGYRANVSFSTSCEGLADDVRELAASLGMRTRLRRSERIGSGSIEYSVYFMIPVEMRSELFLLERHRESVGKYHEHSRKFHRRYDDVAIREVHDLGVEVSMTCITVGSEHHVYLAGKEHIVTHNTALVQGVMNKDRHRMYLEVDLSRMIAGLNDPSELGDKLKRVFADATKFSEREKYGLVLFMDEFHQIVQLSPAAVEALKPLLADSGTRGIHVVAATTLEEFNQYISSNQPLVERLQRISLHSADMDMTVEILKSMAERYGVADEIVGNGLYENIYELTNRHIPANAQPRKSILMLDAMVGWHRAEHRKMNMSLLADVMYDSEGVNIAFRVDPQSIKARLDEKVLSQDLATTSIAKRMQLCVAGLNDPTKPQSTLLFCGPTGCGKTEVTKQLSKILFGDASRSLVRIDMTEFANPDSLERFRLELTSRVWENPYCIVLLDEVEKASDVVTRLLLQVLDDGRLSDRNGREVSFVNCYIIMTTNAGHEIYNTIAQYEADDTGSGEKLRDYERTIRRSLVGTTGGRFPPELVGRIDTIVPFQPLSRNTMTEIVKMRLRELAQKLYEQRNIKLNVQQRVVSYIIEDTLTTETDEGGARAIMSKLESEVITALAEFINAFPEEREIVVTITGRLAHEDVTSRTSDASVIIKSKSKEQGL